MTNARVGQVTDYDKLSLEVWTNGSVKPQDAVAYAAKILKEQLSIFINFEETEEPQYALAGAEDEPLNENLFRSVDELELSRPLGQLPAEREHHSSSASSVQRSEQDMLKTKNFGRKSLKEIKEILANMGLSLGHEDRQLAADDRALEGAAGAGLRFRQETDGGSGFRPCITERREEGLGHAPQERRS